MRLWHQDNHLSLVVMRHPFSRLASAYYDKMVEGVKFYRPMNLQMIDMFREAGVEAAEDIPLPEEFVREGLKNSKTVNGIFYQGWVMGG